MLKGQVLVINKKGLHARAASKLAQATTPYQAEVKIGFPERMVNAKNIMSIMMLGAAQGTSLNVEAIGDDAHEAFAALVDIFARRFDEDE
ncbi:MAG: HPr family phosphocarrier protein [Venatoribacter sp.]